MLHIFLVFPLPDPIPIQHTSHCSKEPSPRRPLLQSRHLNLLRLFLLDTRVDTLKELEVEGRLPRRLLTLLSTVALPSSLQLRRAFRECCGRSGGVARAPQSDGSSRQAAYRHCRVV